MTQLVKGRHYYDICGRRWRAIAVMEDHAVLRRHIFLRTGAERKEDGKWHVHYDHYGFLPGVYLIVEDDL